ncbi:pentapeptide repeat-containing protein [Agromyces sp. SYSU T0242]|uniref:pentapeptide repeat-containing protein n=1 Tax=Agromyces litoreus TaxID=3158561 RepID=UPI003397A0E0
MAYDVRNESPHKWATWVLVGIAAVLAVALAVAVLPTWLAAGAFAGSKEVPSGDEWAVRVSDERRSVLWMLGGIIAVIGVIYTHRRQRLSETEHALLRDENRTNRYTAAVAQIGDTSLDVRLGGIYALERLARDSEPDGEIVWEVLCAFIRVHSRRKRSRTEFPTDVAAALSVLQRARVAGLDLSNADLRGARLAGSFLRDARLTGCNLEGVDLSGSSLAGVEASGANFSDAMLRKCDLIGADLADANFTGANLAEAVLTQSRLLRANFANANLARTSLRGARLLQSDVTAANIASADFDGADLTLVNLADAKNLNQATNLEKAENANLGRTHRR